MENQTEEKLLRAWLFMSAGIRNERMVKGMAFNELLLCGILYQNEKEHTGSTATMLCEKTGMLKSQMNRVLGDLEKKKLIERKESLEDKRKRNIVLTESGRSQYEKEHKDILAIVKKVTDALGEDQAEILASLMEKATIVSSFL